jgi:hypothetical protein
MDFASGGLDVSGHTLVFQDLPTILIDLPSGRGWMGNPTFSTGSSYHLTYYGNVQTLHAPGPEFQSGLVENLTISAVDASNSPPVFGLRFTQDAMITGELRVDSGALLRLTEMNMSLPGSGRIHRIEGTVAGSGHLVLRGDAASLTGSTNTPSRIDRLRLESAGSSSLVNIRQSIDVQAIGGSVTIFGDTPFSIADRMAASNARYIVRQPLSLGSGSAASRLTLNGSEILFGASGRLDILGNPEIQVPAGSRIDLETGANADGMTGLVSMTRSANLVASGGIARLRIDAPASGDDTLMGSDLLITDRFELVNGDVFIGAHDVIFHDADVHIDSDAAAGDGGSDGFFGDLSSQSGQMRFLGASRLTLGGNLSLQSVGLVVDTGENTLPVRSVDALPRVIQANGAPVVLASGVLDLAGNDLEIVGSTAGILTLAGGQVSGTGAGVVDSQQIPVDALYGEVIVSGAGDASIIVQAVSLIDNLRVSGPVQVQVANGYLGVEERFVFGRSGASVVAGAQSDIRLGEEAWVVRRGNGTLSHPLTFASATNVFYDLEGATLASSAELATGLELPGDVQRLVVLAGASGSVQNKVILGRSISVSAGLHVLSGRLQTTGQSVSVAAGADWVMEQVNQAAPGSLSGDTGGVTGGPVHAFVSARSGRLDLGTGILPAALGIDGLEIELEESAGILPSVRLTRGLSVRDMNIQAVNGGTGTAVVRLDGNPLSTTGSLTVSGVTITSAQFATIEVGGETVLGPLASISGSIDLTAFGPARFQGVYSGLALRLGDDAEMLAAVSQASDVYAFGHDQRFLTSGNPTLGRLFLEQSGADARVRVRREDGSPVTLTISGQLSLGGGLLDVGYGVLMLPGSSGGFVRSAANGPSHVIGRTGRRAPSETREDFVFPVGTPDAYTPITITFASPLLSSTDLVAGVRSSDVVSREGLPVTTTDGRVVVDVGPVIWTLESTVNFAQSQPVTVSVALPGAIAGPAADHRLVRRDAGLQGASSAASWTAPWTAPGGSPVASATSTSLIVRQIDATGLLSPQGIEFGVGTTETTSDGSGRLVLVNAVNGPASMVIDGDPVEFVTSQVTNSISVRPGTFSWAVGASTEAPSGSSGAGETREVTIAAGEQVWLILAPGAATDENGQDGGQTDTIAGWSVIEPVPAEPAAGMVAGRLFNARSTDPEIVMTEAGGMPIGFSEGAAPGQLYPSVLSPAFRVEARQQHYAVLSLPDHTGDVYSVDLSPAGGSYGLFIATDGRLDFAASNGIFLNSRISTGIEGNGSGDGAGDGSADDGVDADRAGAELPTEYRLGQNYPNPFNPSTVIPFDLPEPANVRLTVVDLLGRVVVRQDAGTFPAGRHTSLRFRADGLASGTYLYVVEAAGAGRVAGSSTGATWRATGRMVLLR